MWPNLVEYLDRIDSTVQYSWLLEIARTFHRFPHDRITARKPRRAARASRPPPGRRRQWDREVWKASRLEAVFLTNEFDDPLEGWDTAAYVPCLRTDDLVLKLHEPRTIARLEAVARHVDVQDFTSLRLAIGRLFERFVARGARACAISLPPDFAPRRRRPDEPSTPIRKAIHGLDLRPDELEEVRCAVFWMLAEFCAEFRLPFDLMIGPVRNVYPAGVAGGRDLFDRRVSLYDYRELVQSFRECDLSGLDPGARRRRRAGGLCLDLPQRAADGALVVCQRAGLHRQRPAARLQALPKVKLLGYYSDAYKLEFIAPKFNMYRRILADVLAEEAIRGRGWSVEQALATGQTHPD